MKSGETWKEVVQGKRQERDKRVKGRRRINYGSRRSKSPQGSNECRQPGLTVEEGGYSSIKLGGCIDLGAYSGDGKNLLRYLRGDFRLD